MRALGVIVAGLAALALAGASAAGAQEAPAATGNVYLANVLAGPVKVSIDEKPVGEAPSFRANVVPLAAGEHSIAIVTEDGSSVSKVFQFDVADLAQVEGAQFWCVYVVPKGSGSVWGALVKLTADKCHMAMTQPT